MDIIRIIANSFKGIIAYLSSIGVCLYLNIDTVVVTLGAGLVVAINIFKLRDYIKSYMNEGKEKELQPILSKERLYEYTREQEKLKRAELEANKPKARSNTYNR
tara:strand:- start:1405 stop:1716 length:312 start_codon:yes stop_codon:yes gene_type:complete